MVYPSALLLDTLGCRICVWLDLLSPTIMSNSASPSSFMMLSLACGLLESCGLPSVVI
jgi:hypothetical protein